MVDSSFRSWHPSGMEKLQRRFGTGIGLWFRKAVAEEGRSRHSLVRGFCEAAVLDRLGAFDRLGGEGLRQ